MRLELSIIILTPINQISQISQNCILLGAKLEILTSQRRNKNYQEIALISHCISEGKIYACVIRIDNDELTKVKVFKL